MKLKYFYILLSITFLMAAMMIDVNKIKYLNLMTAREGDISPFVAMPHHLLVLKLPSFSTTYTVREKRR